MKLVDHPWREELPERKAPRCRRNEHGGSSSLDIGLSDEGYPVEPE